MDVDEFHITGGARIGLVNASWPFVKLTVSAAELRLSGLIGTYKFKPDDVVSMDIYGWLPVFGRGVRIVHACRDYPAKIIFWCFGSPATLIERIKRSGFSPAAPASSAVRWRGIALRWTFIVFFVLFFEGLGVLVRFIPQGAQPFIALLPMLMAFGVSWLIRVSPRIQRLVLREGRFVNEIKTHLILVQSVSGIILTVFAILLLTGVFP